MYLVLHLENFNLTRIGEMVGISDMLTCIYVNVNIQAMELQATANEILDGFKLTRDCSLSAQQVGARFDSMANAVDMF